MSQRPAPTAADRSAGRVRARLRGHARDLLVAAPELARAGFVVAAPVFPLCSAGAPGGPEESDVINQPGDMSFVISSLLAVSSGGRRRPLAGLVDPLASPSPVIRTAPRRRWPWPSRAATGTRA